MATQMILSEVGQDVTMLAVIPTNTFRQSSEVFEDLPARFRDEFLSDAHGDYVEDEDVRMYVSDLWAEDWDSPEDAVYDQFPSLS